jgi:hypothetical protein
MVAVSTLKIIFLVLLVLSLFSLVRILVHKERHALARALIVSAALGTVLYGLNTVKTEKVSLSLGQLKRLVFPTKTENWEYIEDKGAFQGLPQTRYIFPEPGPELSLTMDAQGGTFAITDVGPVNAVLEYLGLPTVAAGVPELSTITGSSLDLNIYRWEDYPLGVLILERGLCRKLNALNTYHCIMSITVRSRGG